MPGLPSSACACVPTTLPQKFGSEGLPLSFPEASPGLAAITGEANNIVNTIAVAKTVAIVVFVVFIRL